MSLAHLKPGDHLHVLRIRDQRTHTTAASATYVVETVGRRWITTPNGYRFDRNTGLEDAGSYTADRIAFASLEALEHHRQRTNDQTRAAQMMGGVLRWERLDDSELAHLIALLGKLNGVSRA